MSYYNGLSKNKNKQESHNGLDIVNGDGSLVAKSCPTLQPCGLQFARLLYPWDFSGKNTGVGCHFLLQGIFLDPGIEPVSPMSPALQEILYR